MTVSATLYVNGSFLVQSERFDLNEPAVLAFPPNSEKHRAVLKPGVTAYYENLTNKRGALSLLIVLVEGPSNPFAVEALLMQPLIEVIKQACGAKAGHEQIVKGVKKHQYEVEQAMRDVIGGFDMNTPKSFPRFAKK